MPESANASPPPVAGKKRSRQFLEYVESSLKKIKSGISEVESWETLLNLRKEILISAEKLREKDDPKPLVSHTSRTTEAETILMENAFRFSQIFSQQIHSTRSMNKGPYLFCCLMALQLLPLRSFFRKEIYSRTFILFEELCTYDREGLDLFMEAVFSAGGAEDLVRFLPSPYMYNSASLTPQEAKISFSLCPSYITDDLLNALKDTCFFSEEYESKSPAAHSAIFSCEIAASGDEEKVLVLFHLVSIVSHLMKAFPLWVPSTLCIPSIINISCSLLALTDNREVDGTRLDVLYARAAGNVLFGLKQRNALELSEYGSMLLYYLSYRVAEYSDGGFSMSSALKDSWEIMLLESIVSEWNHNGPYSKAGKGTERCTKWSWMNTLIVRSPGIVEVMLRCLLRVFYLAVGAESTSQCQLYLRVFHCVASLLEAVCQELSGDSESGRRYLLGIAYRLDFPGFLKKLIQDVGKSQGSRFLLLRLQRDTCTVSLQILRRLFNLFPSSFVTDTLHQIQQEQYEQASAQPTQENVLSILSIMLCRKAGQLVVSLSELAQITRYFSDSLTASAPSSYVGVIRSFLALLTLYWGVRDRDMWEDFCVAMHFFSQHFKVENYLVEGIFLTEFADALTQFRIACWDSYHGSTWLSLRLAQCTQSLIGTTGRTLEMNIMILTGVVFGIQRHSFRLLDYSSGSLTMDERIRTLPTDDSRISAARITKSALLFKCLDAYIWVIEHYKQTLSSIIRCKSSQSSFHSTPDLMAEEAEDTGRRSLSLRSAPVLLMEPLFSCISEIQLHIFFSVSCVSQLMHEKDIQTLFEKWKTISLPPAVVNVDDEPPVDVASETISIVEVLEDKQRGLLTILLELLATVESDISTVAPRAKTALRRAVCGAAICFSRDLVAVSKGSLKHWLVDQMLEAEGDIVCRCGYGALAASLVMHHCGDSFSFIDACQKKWAKEWPYHNDSLQSNVRSLVLLSCIFRKEWREHLFISAGIPVYTPLPNILGESLVGAAQSDTLLQLLYLSIGMISKKLTPKLVAASGSEITLIPAGDALRYFAREVTRDLLFGAQWSEGDIFRYQTEAMKDVLVFIKRLMLRKAPSVVRRAIAEKAVLNVMDHVVGTEKLDHVEEALRVLDDDLTENKDLYDEVLKLGAVVARLLWDQKHQRVFSEDDERKLLSLINNTPEDRLKDVSLQRIVRRAFFFLLSLEGEYQLKRYVVMGDEGCYMEEDSEVFYKALRQLVSLMDLPKLTSHSFTNMKESEDAPRKLSGDLFLILHMILKLVDAVDMPLTVIPTSLGTVRRRWLLAIRSLIRFLGEKVVLIASNVSSLLKMFSVDSSLTGVVASVWCQLIQHCTKEYLHEHLPVLLLELLALEQECWANRFGLMVLHDALSHLFSVSSNQPVWEASLRLFSTASPILLHISQTIGKQLVEAASLSNVFHGFLYLFQSCSVKGKVRLVRALYAYLQSLQRPQRGAVIASVASSEQQHAPRVVQALLQLTKEVTDETEDVMLDVLGCIGFIGAIITLNTNTLSSSSLKERDSSASLTTITSPTSNTAPSSRWIPERSNMDSSNFDIKVFLSWRKFLFKVLNDYLPRALTNTSMSIHQMAAYASQEMIRVGIESEKKEAHPSSRHRQDTLAVFSWWKELPIKARQLLEVFESTDYVLEKIAESSYTDDTYLAWLFGFHCEVFENTTVRFKKLVLPLRRLVKSYLPLLTWSFPYIVLDALHHEDTVRIIAKHFSRLFANREQSNKQDRIFTCLKLMEYLRQAHWYLLQLALRKSNNIELTPEACDTLAKRIYLFLQDLPVNTGDMSSSDSTTPFWAKRVLAALSLGNRLMALRFIESQRRLPSVQDVEEVVGKDSLRNIFTTLGDFDSVKGLYQGTSVMDPGEAAFICESNGEWSSAIQNCEVVLQREPNSIPHQVTLLRCLRQLGQLQLAARYADNILHSTNGGLQTYLSEEERRRIEVDACEAAWRLGDWEHIDNFSEQNGYTIPSLAFPVLQWMRVVRGESPVGTLFEHTEEERRKLAPIIRSVPLDNYSQLSPWMVMLHGLHDLEYSISLLAKPSAGEYLEQPKNGWSSKVLSTLATTFQVRLERVEDTLEVKEPLISLHRCIFEELSMTRYIPSTYEVQIKMLRERGYLQAALAVAKQPHVRGVSASIPPFYVSTAELLYETGSKIQAIAYTTHSIANLKKRDVKSKLHLLLTDWQMEASDQTQDEIIRGYETAIHLDASEQAHHKLALFYEKLFLSSGRTNATTCDDQHRFFTALKAIEHFGAALMVGYDSLLVSLPRLLTLWLDTVYELVVKDQKSTTKKDVPRKGSTTVSQPFKTAEQYIHDFNSLVDRLLNGENGISHAYIVTALPQLLSRLEHPHPNVVGIIAQVVAKLLKCFPQPCLWHVLPIAFGKPDSTANIVKDRILNRFSQGLHNANVRRNAEKIFESLIALCNAPPDSFRSGARLTQMPFMKEVSVLVQNFDFILPTLANMTPDVCKSKRDSDVFPGKPTFKGFDDSVIFMKSKQQPKKIQVRSSDGKMVPFLCKADDEPRKDIRMMDLASLINKFLLHDTNARRRCLSLRRYSVAALSNKCALIEWVNDLAPLYGLVMQCYHLCRLGIDERRIKTYYDEAKAKNIRKVDLLRNTILPVFPPIFHCWFDKQFSCNEDWYRARCLYTDSTALWNIAGHIVGLGDRHGENILLNERTAEVMHVDFAEMFDSAELLPVPEIVRFRLTPNVIDGMGVVGTSGPYQTVCSIVLACQMKNSNALMSIAETHLYEPLNKCSKFSIQRMSRRLNGYLDFYNTQTRSAFPLSTVALNAEGQVAKLISHSSSLENLSEMYTWWRPWI